LALALLKNFPAISLTTTKRDQIHDEKKIQCSISGNPQDRQDNT